MNSKLLFLENRGNDESLPVTMCVEPWAPRGTSTQQGRDPGPDQAMSSWPCQHLLKNYDQGWGGAAGHTAMLVTQPCWLHSHAGHTAMLVTKPVLHRAASNRIYAWIQTISMINHGSNRIQTTEQRSWICRIQVGRIIMAVVPPA